MCKYIFKLQDVTVDLLKQQLKKNGSAKAFVIEGFPRDKSQVEAFNKHVSFSRQMRGFAGMWYVKEKSFKNAEFVVKKTDFDRQVTVNIRFTTAIYILDHLKVSWPCFEGSYIMLSKTEVK